MGREGVGRSKPTTLPGILYDECISESQKMIRRGKERESLELAQESFASGYPAAVARRPKRRKYEGDFGVRPVMQDSH